jgi:hypothetical protein
VIKAIESFLKSQEAATATHLPQNLIEMVKKYTSGQHDFAKVHDELNRLKKTVNKNNNKSEAMFLECVALLAPKLSSSEQLNQWFIAYVDPAINSASNLNSTAQSARNFFLSVLNHGTNPLSGKKLENEADLSQSLLKSTVVIETPSQLYFHKIYQIYEGSSESYFQLKDENTLDLAERRRFIIQNAREILTEFGKSHPKQFFTMINQIFLVPENRKLVLSLVSNLLGTHERADFSKVSDTQFLESLYNCLLLDNSSAILSIGINVLVMLIPYNVRRIPLSKLLLIFGRLVIWNAQQFSKSASYQESKAADLQAISETDFHLETSNKETDWKILYEVFICPDAKPIDLLPFFSFLYGLFPYNFLKFSRSPSVYLISTGYQESIPSFWNDEKIILSVKSMSHKFTLNSFLINYSQEQELNDSSRWNTPAEDLAAHCLSLNMSKNSRYDSFITRKLEDESFQYAERPNSPKSPTVSSVNSKSHLPFDESPASFTYENYLLRQHEQLYKKPEQPTTVVQTSTPSIDMPQQSTKQKSGYPISPVFLPLTSFAEGLKSPLLISYSGPSSGITPITVSHPHPVQNHRKNSDPESFDLSPMTAYSSHSENDLAPDDDLAFNSSIKQQIVQTTDPYLLFYQRELSLMKNEIDFSNYLERITRHAYQSQLDFANTTQIDKSQIEYLTNLVKTLKEKNLNLELISKKAHSEYKELRSKMDTCTAGMLKDNKDLKFVIKDLAEKLSKNEEELEISRKKQKNYFDILIQKQTKISVMEDKITHMTEALSKLDFYKNSLIQVNNRVKHLEELKPNFMTPYERDHAMDALSNLKKFEDSKNAALFETKNIKLQAEIERKGYKYQIRHEQEKSVISNKSRESFENFRKSQLLADEEIKELRKQLKNTQDNLSRLSDEVDELNLANKQLETLVANYEEQIRLLDQTIKTQSEMTGKLMQELNDDKSRHDVRDHYELKPRPGRGGFQNSRLKKSSTISSVASSYP